MIHTPTYTRRFLAGCLAALILTSTGFSTGRLNQSGSLRGWSADGSPVEATTLFDGFGLSGMIERGELVETSSLSSIGRSDRIVYQQYYRGLPVIGGRLVVRLNRDGMATRLHSSLAKIPAAASVPFSINRSTAIELARRVVSIDQDANIIRVEQSILPRPEGIVPVWSVTLRTSTPVGLWRVLVNGTVGAVVLTEDRLLRLDGRGQVFDPDPKSVTGDSTLTDQDDAADAIPEDAYNEATLLDITQADDSLYTLTGPYVDTAPTANRARSDDGSFLFDREDDRFEEVMAYFHLDRQARYVQALGFDELPPSPIYVNSNGMEDDVSFYDPEDGIITTGTGGVDDAEDADVLLHEYTHALIERIIPDWRGGDTPLLIEGLCDYFAGDGSYSMVPEYLPDQVYSWDGHNEFWGGRVLNAEYHYPEDAGRERHDAGQIWSGALFEVCKQAGDRDAWNRVVLDHLFSLADSANVPDAAEALLASDLVLTEGRFRVAILEACEKRGILPTGIHRPQISHRPLKDTEDLNQSREVSASIESELPVDLGRTLLVYRFDDQEPDTAEVAWDQQNPDLYRWTIPGPGRETRVEYYLIATDSTGVFATLPVNAPAEKFAFSVGPDLTPPTIVSFAELPNTVFAVGEINVQARVTDNLGVNRVYLGWNDPFLEAGGSVQLQAVDDSSGLFTGRLEWDARGGGEIQYQLVAEDSAAANNRSRSASRSFYVHQEATVDDFEGDALRWSLGGWNRNSEQPCHGEWSLHDRADSTGAPREAVAMLDETWNFAGLRHARLLFAERHLFDRRVMEQGSVEVLVEGEENAREVARFIGWSGDWSQVEINLDRYATNESPSIRVRFRTTTPAGANALPGWFIDDVRLRVGNIVEAATEELPLPEVSLLSEPFPNPTNSSVRFSVQTVRGGTVELLEVSGRRVLELEVGAGIVDREISLEALPTGLYYLRIRGGAVENTRRVVLVR